MIVLKKHVAYARFVEHGGAVGLCKESPMITVQLRRDSDNLRNLEWIELEGHVTVGWKRASY